MKWAKMALVLACTRKMSNACTCEMLCPTPAATTGTYPCDESTFDAKVPTICSAPSKLVNIPTKLIVIDIREYRRKVGTTFLFSILPKYALRAVRVMVHVQNELTKAMATPIVESAKPLDQNPVRDVPLLRTDCANVSITPLTTLRTI